MKDIKNLLQEEGLYALFAAAGTEPVTIREIALLADQLGYDRNAARNMLQEAANRGIICESRKGFTWVGVRPPTLKSNTLEGKALEYVLAHPFEGEDSPIINVLNDPTVKTRLGSLANKLQVVRVKLSGDKNFRYAAAVPLNWMELPPVDREITLSRRAETTLNTREKQPESTLNKRAKKPEVRRVEKETLPPRSIDKSLTTSTPTPNSPLGVGSSVTFQKREVAKEGVREIPKVEIQEVVKEVPVEVIKQVEVIKTITNTVHSGLTLSPEMNALIQAVPEAEKAILDSLHDTELLISAAQKRDQLYQNLGRMLVQLSLTAQITTTTEVVEPVKVPEPEPEPVKVPEPDPIKAPEPEPLTSGAAVMAALVKVHGVPTVRRMVESFTLGHSAEFISSWMKEPKTSILNWKKQLGGGQTYRLAAGINLPQEEVRSNRTSVRKLILDNLPEYVPFRQQEEAEEMFVKIRQCLNGTIDLWEQLPKEEQRALLGYTVCLARHAQEVLGGRQNLSQEQGGIFSWMTRWSAEQQPGFVYGLRNSDEPYDKSWWHDARQHVAALDLPIPEVKAKVVTPILPAQKAPGFTMGDLVLSVQEGIDDTLLEAMVDYLLDREGINQKHLIQVLVPVREQLPKKPAFKRLLSQIYKKYDELNPEEEDTEDDTSVLPANWPGFVVTEGKHILLMGGDERQSALSRLKTELKTESIQWVSGWTTSEVNACAKRVKQHGYDLVILLLGFNNRQTVEKTVTACKEVGIPFVTPRTYGLKAVQRAIETLPQVKEKDNTP